MSRLISRLVVIRSWIRQHVGRRGAFLAFLVVLDISYGSALLTTQIRALPGAPRPDFFLSLHAWGWVWAATGVFLATGIPVRRDISQYTVAALLKAVWGLLYADLWLVQHEPMAWISVIIWLSFALTVLVVSGWPEPGPARKLLEETANGTGPRPAWHDIGLPQEDP